MFNTKGNPYSVLEQEVIDDDDDDDAVSVGSDKSMSSTGNLEVPFFIFSCLLVSYKCCNQR